MGLAGYGQSVSQKRNIFYRLTPKGITMAATATSGSVSLNFLNADGSNATFLTSSYVGTRMRYSNRQVLITAVGSGHAATAIVQETLPASQVLTFGSNPNLQFQVGDVVIGSSSSAQAIVIAFPSNTTMTVQNLRRHLCWAEWIAGGDGSVVRHAAADHGLG